MAAEETNVPVLKDFKEEAAKYKDLTVSQIRRLQDKKEWNAYWEFRKKEAEGKFWKELRYKAVRIADWPVTWFRENIVEPNHDKHKMPYYHRKISRVPEIDQCGVRDKVCIFEANEQYRLDRMVDTYILDVLQDRMERCIMFWEFDNLYKCSKVIDDYEENNLNFFIKYGELGSESDVVDVYMKQKHRLIWERRHPEIMEERKRTLEDHKAKLKEGKFDLGFWNPFHPFVDKRSYGSVGNVYGHNWRHDKTPAEGDMPISKDWRYYKKLAEDPEFDKRNYPKSLNEKNRERMAREQKD